MEVPPRIELGIRELQSHALPLGYGTVDGADDEARTRYLHLGKVALYQMSYIRKVDVFGQNRFPAGKPRRFQQSTGLLPRAAFRFRLSAKQKRWCLRAESNHRHGDFQSPALPTELQRRSTALSDPEPSPTISAEIYYTEPGR